jgi:6,7-dimethyl-8-ribityllumazine synthase
MDMSVARKLALGNGILTVENEEQAVARAYRNRMNKGGDAAQAALAMVRLKRSVGAGA